MKKRIIILSAAAMLTLSACQLSLYPEELYYEDFLEDDVTDCVIVTGIDEDFDEDYDSDADSYVNEDFQQADSDGYESDYDYEDSGEDTSYPLSDSESNDALDNSDNGMSNNSYSDSDDSNSYNDDADNSPDNAQNDSDDAYTDTMITEEEALQLVREYAGDGYGFISEGLVERNGTYYYQVRMTWKVDEYHSSTVNIYLVNSDGSEILDYFE